MEVLVWCAMLCYAVPHGRMEGAQGGYLVRHVSLASLPRCPQRSPARPQ